MSGRKRKRAFRVEGTAGVKARCKDRMCSIMGRQAVWLERGTAGGFGRTVGDAPGDEERGGGHM